MEIENNELQGNEGKIPNVDVVDVEKNAPANNDDKFVGDIPSRMDIFYDLNGSLGFAIGSSGFILSMYYDNWLPYFRYGSLFWIWGCVLYSIPLLLKLRGKDGGCAFTWGIGDIGEFACYLGYTIGCIFGGFFGAEAIDNKFLPTINHSFLYGSLFLALEPLYQAFLLLTRGGSCLSRMRASKLCGSPSDVMHNNSTITCKTVSSEDTEARVSPPPLKLNWDRLFELCAMIFFCAAGVFGGFPPHPSLALPGQYFWEVGSLFSVARSLLMIQKRNRGLKAIQ